MPCRSNEISTPVLTALPETEFIAVGIVEEREHATDFLLCRSRLNTARAQIAYGIFDIADTEAETSIAGAGDGLAMGRRHEFEEYAIDLEAGDIVTRLQGKAQHVSVEEIGRAHV